MLAARDVWTGILPFLMDHYNMQAQSVPEITTLFQEPIQHTRIVCSNAFDTLLSTATLQTHTHTHLRVYLISIWFLLDEWKKVFCTQKIVKAVVNNFSVCIEYDNQLDHIDMSVCVSRFTYQIDFQFEEQKIAAMIYICAMRCYCSAP